MEIDDWAKVATEAQVVMDGPQIRALKAYHQLFFGEIDNHHHRIIGATQMATGTPYWGKEPKPETCDCEGRKRLERLKVVWKDTTHCLGWWCRMHNGEARKMTVCPLCDQTMPRVQHD